MKTENTTSLQGIHKKYFKNGQLKEVKLFKNNEILWDEIAFPTVEKKQL